MFKSFLVSMFAIFLFTLGAAGAWFYLQLSSAEPAAADRDVPLAGQVSEAADPVPSFAASGPSEVLPAVLRGPALDADEMVRLQMATSAREEQLRQHEERLRDQRIRIKAADADTKAAQREVEGALSQTRNMMDAAEKLLDEIQLALEALKKEAKDLELRKEDLSNLEKDAGADTAANIKTFAEYMQSMPATAAADTLKEMINGGKMDFAIQLLRDMEPRNVSKILAEIKDSVLLAEIAQRYPLAPTYR